MPPAPGTAPERVAQRIREEFLARTGDRSGQQLPRVRDLARSYGVSPGTVSSALGILAAQGLVKKRQGRGCFAAEPASSATAGDSPRLLGLVLPSATTTDIMMRICEGVERATRTTGYHMLVTITDWDYDREREAVARMVNAGCGGLVLYPTPRRRRHLQEDYLNSEFRDLPIVLVDMAFSGQRRSSVTFDNVRAGRQMTELLIRRGHRQIAFMTVNTAEGDLCQRSNQDRREGYEAALLAAGLRPRAADRWTVTWQGKDRRTEIGTALDRWTTDPGRPSAVLAVEDYTAVLLIQEARARGISVPKELDVAGFDGLPLGAAISPAFPTTAPDFRRAGELAAELALRELRGEIPAPVSCTLDVPLLRTAPDALPQRDVPGAPASLP